MSSIVEVLPFDVNQYILSFLKVRERIKLARVCTDFLKMNENLSKNDFWDFDETYIFLYLNVKENEIIIQFENNWIDYQTLQRLMKCLGSIKLCHTYNDSIPTYSSVTCNQFFEDCVKLNLFSQIRIIECKEMNWFTKDTCDIIFERWFMANDVKYDNLKQKFA